MTKATPRGTANTRARQLAAQEPASLPDVLKLPPGEYRVKLTAADAEELLKRNKHNRSIVETDVLKWAMEMAEGRWRYNGEAIKIAQDGTILDGQHRLLALAMQDEGVVIEVLIVTGLPNETQVTMDQGRKRGAADQLSLSGIDADRSFASAIRLFLLWSEGWMFKDTREVRARMTATRLVDWANEHPDTIMLLRDGSRFRNIQARAGLVIAVYAMVAQKRGSVLATEFFQHLLDGVGLPAGSPILALRNRLAKQAAERINVTDRDMLGMFISTFNHWQKGHTLVKVQLPKGGSYTASTFPTID